MKAKDKDARGVGKQGFKHNPAVVEWAHTTNLHSNRAYQAIRKVMPLPTTRSFQ